MNITYNEDVITGVGTPDPLQSVDFFVDGVNVLSLDAPDDSPLAISLSIPGVSNLPVGGGTVMSDAEGTFYLTLPDNNFLDLKLDEAEIVYIALNSLQLHFALGASAAEVLGQLLPIEGEFAGDVSISFSTNVDSDSLASEGGFLTAFVAAGTGEIKGSLVPEPSTLALLLLGMLGLFASRRSR